MDKQKLNNHLYKIQEMENVEEGVGILAATAIMGLAKNIAFIFRYFLMSKIDAGLSKMMDDTFNEERVKQAYVKSFTGKRIGKKVMKYGGKKPTDFTVEDHFKVRVYPSNSPNAFVFVGRPTDLFVTKGLISILNQKEIKAVLLHEIGHMVGYKTYRHAITSAGASLTLAMIVAKIFKNVGLKMFLKGPYGIILVGLKMALENLFGIKIDPVRATVNRYLGRPAEIEADNFAVESGYGKELISSFKKMSNKFKDNKCDTKFCQITRSIASAVNAHPSIEERVKRILSDPNLVKQASPKKIAKKLAGK